MPDIGAIASALSALNGAKDIAQAMIGLRDSQAFQGKLIEFQSKLIEANSAALAAQDERTTLLERIRDLERKVARLEAWETEKQRYQLTDIGDGTFAYALKESMRGTEPPHYICAHCYEQSKKAILHNMQMGSGQHLLTCPSCTTKLIVGFGYIPPSYAATPEEKARLALPPCPICNEGRMKITASEQDGTFGFAGVQRRTLKCDRCPHTESQLYDPNGNLNRQK
jgi:Zn finger protein HypA/HybF involved in hydrogenase expression